MIIVAFKAYLRQFNRIYLFHFTAESTHLEKFITHHTPVSHIFSVRPRPPDKQTAEAEAQHARMQKKAELITDTCKTSVRQERVKKNVS